MDVGSVTALFLVSVSEQFDTQLLESFFSEVSDGVALFGVIEYEAHCCSWF